MTEGKDTVDNEARTDIAVIKERIEHLSYVVTSHMDAEEKQREKLDHLAALGLEPVEESI